MKANRDDSRQKKPLHKKYVYRRIFLLIVAAVLVVAIAFVTRYAYIIISSAKQEADEELLKTELSSPVSTSDTVMGPPLGASEKQYIEDERKKKEEQQKKKEEEEQRARKRIETEEKKREKDWNLILVNPENPIAEDFEVELERVHENMFLDKRIVDNFKQMVVEAKKAGINLELVNAYIDPLEQENLFNAELEKLIKEGHTPEKAQQLASKDILPPWYSEHHTGLSVDLSTTDCEMREDFECTAAHQWLEENAWEYGFVLRYPLGKRFSTKTDYTPYHYRYVGEEVAEIIQLNSWTLEEYLDARLKGQHNVILSEQKNKKDKENPEDEKAETESSNNLMPEDEQDVTYYDEPEIENEFSE